MIPTTMTAVASITALYQAIDDNDVDALVTRFAPQASYWRPGYPPIIGRAALDLFYRRERVIRCGSHVVDSVLHNGDEIAVQGRFEGEMKTGQRIALRFADFFTLDSGGLLATRRTFFFTPLV